MENTDPFQGMDDAPTFKVVEAHREAVPALIALWGFSDSGKTFSALRLARGLVGPKGKIVLIDTENKRAKHYSGLFGGFSHLDLQPPFTPQRHTAAFEAAIAAGANVIIVDSTSHVWEGEGGVLEQADASTVNGLMKWKAPKMAYMRMVNRMLRSPVHVIFCLRAKEKYVQVGQGKSAKIELLGQEPICGKRFVFEMTVSAHMESGTRKPLDPVKIPEGMINAIKPGEFITEDCGRKIAEWLAGGSPVDHIALALQASARDIAAQGTIRLRDWYQALTKPQRATLKDMVPELKAMATTADDEAAKAAHQADETANGPGEVLDDPFTAGAPKAAE
jgi:hypothetical protein